MANINLFDDLLFRLRKPFCDVVPVHDVVNCCDVVWPYILVLQVIRMLPNINAKERNEPCGFDVI